MSIAHEAIAVSAIAGGPTASQTKGGGKKPPKNRRSTALWDQSSLPEAR